MRGLQPPFSYGGHAASSASRNGARLRCCYGTIIVVEDWLCAEASLPPLRFR